jgi:hypothetical protein
MSNFLKKNWTISGKSMPRKKLAEGGNNSIILRSCWSGFPIRPICTFFFAATPLRRSS